jgi:ubiquitin carboxyl-terminal hydrolase 48
LKNLGATCYVNSLLQVIFHNPFLRKAIYLWDPAKDRKEIINKCNGHPETSQKAGDDSLPDSLIDFNPVSAVGHLQRLFASLQFGYVSCIDPSPFVRSLDLDINQQQDAQEFCKLFLSLMEDELAYQTNPLVKTIIQDEFQGEQAYITTCMKCQNESRNPSSFYELTLHIEGLDRVEDSLNHFITAETLEGDNAYSCLVCGEKTIANRRIAITKLPPTLNIQLLRFVYDYKKGVRRKLCSEISFPEKIDMQNYMTAQNSPAKGDKKPIIYNLRAILAHHGKTAHSGHYVAHIKDVRKDVWYKFNDERVELIGDGTKLRRSMDSQKLSQEIEVIDEKVASFSKGRSKPNKSGKMPLISSDRCHSSEAYMLVYQIGDRDVFTIDDDDDQDWRSYLSPHIQKLLADEETKFNAWTAELKKIQQRKVDLFNQKVDDVSSIFDLQNEYLISSASTSPSSAKKGRPRLEIVSKDFLNAWFKNDPRREPQEMSLETLVCSHGHLRIDKISSFKVLPIQAADIIFGRMEKFEKKSSRTAVVKPRQMTEHDLCYECVYNEIVSQQKYSQITNDAKLVSDMVKTACQTANGYFVGKESFSKWKNLAKQTFKIPIYKKESSSNGNGVCNDDDPELKPVAGISKTPLEDDDSNGPVSLKFNEDLLCHHNKLSNETNKRRTVTEQVWQVFSKYFPDAPVFTPKDPICPECEEEEEQQEERERLLWKRAEEEKYKLNDIYTGKNRPNLSADDDDLTILSNDVTKVKTEEGGGGVKESDDDDNGEVSFLSSTSPFRAKRRLSARRRESKDASSNPSLSEPKKMRHNSSSETKVKKQSYLVSMKFVRKLRSFIE